MTDNENMLLSCLFLMCDQYLTENDDKGEMFHRFVSAGETALGYLERAGYVTQVKTGWYVWTEKRAEFEAQL